MRSVRSWRTCTRTASCPSCPRSGTAASTGRPPPQVPLPRPRHPDTGGNVSALATATGGERSRRPSPELLEQPQANISPVRLVGRAAPRRAHHAVPADLGVHHQGGHPARGHRDVGLMGPGARRRRPALRRPALDLVARVGRDRDLQRVPALRRRPHQASRGYIARPSPASRSSSCYSEARRREHGGARARERAGPVPPKVTATWVAIFFILGIFLALSDLDRGFIRENSGTSQGPQVDDRARVLRDHPRDDPRAARGARPPVAQRRRLRGLGLLHVVLPGHAPDRPAVPDLPRPSPDRVQPRSHSLGGLSSP